MRSFMIVGVLVGIVALSLAAGGPRGGTGEILSAAETRGFTDRFLTALENTRPFDAFQLVRAAVNDPQFDVDTLRTTAEASINNARNTYGRSVGHELIGTKSLGDSFIRYDYLFRLEKSALHFQITFYKNGRNRYVPVDMFFEDDLTQVFYDLGK